MKIALASLLPITKNLGQKSINHIEMVDTRNGKFQLHVWKAHLLGHTLTMLGLY